MRQNGLLRETLPYAAAIGVAVAFYFWFQLLPADEPGIFLAPLSGIVSLLSGIPFTFQPGIGYAGVTFSGTVFLIAKPCAGGNFFLICFLLLSFTGLRKIPRTRARYGVIPCAFAASYIAAVAASALRVASTVFLWGLGLGIDPMLIHNAVGVVTYLCAICVCYLAANKLVFAILTRRSCSTK